MKVVLTLVIYLLNLNFYEASSLNNLVSIVGNLIREAPFQNEKQNYNEHGVAELSANDIKVNNYSNFGNYADEEKYNQSNMCKKFGRCGCGRSKGCSERYERERNLDKLVADVNGQLLEDLKGDSLKKEIIKETEEENLKEKNIKDIKEISVIVMTPQDAKLFLQSLKYHQNHTGKLLESIISDILDVTSATSSESSKLKRSSIPFSPKEISKYYNEYKDELIQRIYDYVKNIPPKRPYLTLKPRWQFEKLKEIYKKEKMNNSELKRKILEMLLGNDSNIRIHPHKNKNLYEIVVPKWVYIAFYKMRKNKKQGIE